MSFSKLKVPKKTKSKKKRIKNVKTNIKKLVLLTLTMPFLASLSSCQSLSHVSEQCSPVFVYIDETQKLIDADASFCSVRRYEFSQRYVGPVPGTMSKRPIQYCDRCVGFVDYADTASFWERVRQKIARSQLNSASDFALEVNE